MAASTALLRRRGALQDLLLKYRWASSQAVIEKRPVAPAAGPVTPAKTTTPGAEVVYEGAMARTLRGVKILSLSSFCFSSLGAPVLAFHTYPDVPLVAKSAIASMMIMISAITTAGLHWFAGPYVRRLRWKPGSREIELETMNLLARTVKWRFELSDIQPPQTNKPLATFYAKGNHYYIDEDKFPSTELLRKLKKRAQ